MNQKLWLDCQEESQCVDFGMWQTSRYPQLGHYREGTIIVVFYNKKKWKLFTWHFLVFELYLDSEFLKFFFFFVLQKWSKGKVRDKLNNLVFFDKATYDKLYKEVTSYKLITPSVVSERLKIRGSLAKLALRELHSMGKFILFIQLIK